MNTMKHQTLTILLTALMTSLLLAAGGKNLRMLVVTPTPAMHCNNCENKIKSNLRFEKGVVQISTSLEKQTVSITYNGSKTNAEALRAALKKIGYETTVVSDRPVSKEPPKAAQCSDKNCSTDAQKHCTESQKPCSAESHKHCSESHKHCSESHKH